MWTGEGRTKTQRLKAPTLADVILSTIIGTIWEGLLAVSESRPGLQRQGRQQLLLTVQCSELFTVLNSSFFLLQTTVVPHNSQQKVSSQPYTTILMLSFIFRAYSSHLLWLLSTKARKISWDTPSTSWPLAACWNSAKPCGGCLPGSSPTLAGGEVRLSRPPHVPHTPIF